MGRPPRLTLSVLMLLSAMLEAPGEEWYGLELAERVDLRSGTIYPALSRLEQAGWLTSRWEEVDPKAVGRPRRRLYHLTGEGETAGRTAVEAHLSRLGVIGRERSPEPLRPRLRPA